MSANSNQFAELQELLDLVCENRATAEHFNRVQELAMADPAAMEFYVDYLDQHARLLWRFRRFAADSAAEATPSCPINLSESSGAESSGATGAFGSLPAAAPLATDFPPQFSQFVSLAESGEGGQGIVARVLSAIGRPFHFIGMVGSGRGRLTAPTIAICFGLLCFGLGAAAFRWFSATNRGADRSQIASETDNRIGKLLLAQGSATLLNLTNCYWDSTGGAANPRDGGEIRPGQSLNLVEGIAEIVSSQPVGGSNRFVLEGPLAMVVVGESESMLHYGKLFIALDPQDQPFTLGTPLGQIVVEGSASLGVVAANQSVVLHVFSGSATFKLLWAETLLDEQRRFEVRAGSSLHLTTNSDGEMKIDRGVANDRCFTVSVSMSDSRLNRTSAYVDAVRRASPLAYWRFEAIENGFVRNEIDNRWHARIHGMVGSRDYLGNRSGEFGLGQSNGYVMTDDNFGDLIREAYTIEAWAKPSHIHSGTLVGLIDWSRDNPLSTNHGGMLTLTGPAGPWAQVKPESFDPPKLPSNYKFHPERVRFLHRRPTGISGGTDCYSSQSYELRKWQHFVCVKDADEMRLYVDGQLSGEMKDETPLPAGLRLIIGQLYPSSIGGHSVYRQFVGEIDEVAFYDRALSDEEIVAHSEIVQNSRSENDPLSDQ